MLPGQAKEILKAEYQNLKLKILQKLTAQEKSEPAGLKAWITKIFDNLFGG
jgi:hypothetical protein